MLSAADVQVLDEIRRGSAAVVGSVIPTERVVLLDVPHHANCGDTLIRLGEERLLDRLGKRVLKKVSFDYRLWGDLERLPGDVTVLLHGGGNFGDLYKEPVEFRNEVIRRMPNHRIVVLPQSVGFLDGANAKETRDIMRAHGGVTVLVRDSVSMARFEDLFEGVDGLHCTDMGLWGDLDLKNAQSRDKLECLARGDGERGDVDISIVRRWGFEVHDWDTYESQRRRWTLKRKVGHAVTHRVPVEVWDRPGLRGIYRLWDRANLQLTLNWNRSTLDDAFEKSRFVVTNRLHAHIVCCLKGIPHVVLDNSTNKISAAFNDYTHRFSTAHLAQGADELEELLRVQGVIAA